MEQKDLKAIAELVVAGLAARLDRPTLTRHELADFLGLEYKGSAFFYIIRNDPTFPKPFSLSDNGRPRWDKAEVKEWLKTRRAKAKEKYDKVLQSVL